MLLTRKNTDVAAAGPRLRRLAGAAPTGLDRRTFLKRSGLVAGAGAFASQLPYGAIGKSEAKEGQPAKVEVKRTVCTSLLGRLRRRRDRRERRVDAAGAGVRLAAEPGCALREGRVPPRARDARALDALEDAGQARQRQVPEDQLGPGDGRDQQEDARVAQGVRPGLDLLGRQLEAQQRAGVPDAQVRVVLGHEQLRSPGADLPLDDGRRRSQHLGLRRDDQLVQRHAEHEVRDVHRQQRGRGAPGVDAAHAAREGDGREDDRRRPALHAHGGEGRRVRADPLRNGYSVRVRHALPHLQERLGGQAVHPRPRLRHGEDQGRSDDQVDAGQGAGSLRRARGDRSTRSPR